MAHIHLSLTGSPPYIQITREGVSNAIWDEIATRIANTLPNRDHPIVVGPGKFLRDRLTLRGVLARHGIDLTADDNVQILLRNTDGDEQALREAIAQPEGSSLVPNVGDMIGNLRLTRELRPFQRRDLARLIFLRHGANFSVPGAGKTTVTYVLHAIERARGRVDKLLVVCPISAFDAWEEEIERVFEPVLTVARWRAGSIPNTEVVITNFQRLPGVIEHLGDWMGLRHIHLVIDEAHRAKRGSLGEWGRTLLSLAPLARRRDILTGTPAPNHPKDIAPLLDMLWPSEAASRRLPASTFRASPPISVMSDVHAAIRPLFVRTKKIELNLPPVEFNPLLVKAGELQQQIYAALRNRYAGLHELDRHDQEMLRRMGDVFMHLLQAASSPRLLSGLVRQPRTYRYPSLAIPAGSQLAKLIDSYTEHEVAPKIARACALIKDNADANRKTLVWSNFPDNLLDLKLQLAALEPAVIYGDIPTRENAGPGISSRDDELERFRTDPRCKVLLANPAAMSEGVSLHLVCNEAIYIDRTFNAGQYLQSLDRIHRLGLPPDTRTRVTLLLTEGTIDVRVDRRVDEKTQRLAGVLDDPHLVSLALPDEDDYGESLDEPDDLEEILAHLREARDDE